MEKPAAVNTPLWPTDEARELSRLRAIIRLAIYDLGVGAPDMALIALRKAGVQEGELPLWTKLTPGTRVRYKGEERVVTSLIRAEIAPSGYLVEMDGDGKGISGAANRTGYVCASQVEVVT
jgi:hypothetical protein